ncbi:VWA-like domain-containing protein [Pontiella sulfatireligans]|uniref:Metallopeptidase domain-containing protein n=1 Tax=Pontiella sulfatireligans TaxID=2750658 RepID=A0A6C2UHG9_9BACT|nr:VWA-like domain-containing protein [Pontiella sulfatireligans]VGO18794.1 hypothetical protein SCARR_00847 [Pontiella sulfatireligans]
MDTITLETIRQLMKRELGSDSFIAGIVSSVAADSTIPTACINAAGALKYNPAFVREHVKTEQDLFCLVFHEILHPAFGHFIHVRDDVSNIACDAIINALISQFYAKASGSGSLFERFYKPKGLESILRPGSKNHNSRFAFLYQHLYPRWTMSSELSAGEVIQTLKMLVLADAAQPVLLGSHGGSNPWKPEQLQGVATEVAQQVRSEEGSWGNQFNGLKALVIEIMKTKRSIRQELLLSYTTRKRLDEFFCEERNQRRTTSPFPLNPSRRDMVMLGADIWPGVFRNRQPEINRTREGVAIFLDVSGSVNQSLPEICGLLARYRRNIRSVYQFSNAVSEIGMAELMEGRVKTTGGTDFNCVAETILDEGFLKAVVITDGYASLSNENYQRLKQAGVRLLTILFGVHNNGDALAPFGEVVRLNEITEGKS